MTNSFIFLCWNHKILLRIKTMIKPGNRIKKTTKILLFLAKLFLFWLYFLMDQEKPALLETAKTKNEMLIIELEFSFFSDFELWTRKSSKSLFFFSSCGLLLALSFSFLFFNILFINAWLILGVFLFAI